MTTRPVAIDWFRLVWDCVQRGRNLAYIERHTGISASTLRGYLDGSQPPHWRGELLLAQWAEATGRDRSEAPRVELSTAPRVIRRRSHAPESIPSEAIALELAWRGTLTKRGTA